MIAIDALLAGDGLIIDLAAEELGAVGLRWPSNHSLSGNLLVQYFWSVSQSCQHRSMVSKTFSTGMRDGLFHHRQSLQEANPMTLIGHVRNGTVVFAQPLQVPDGTVARVHLEAVNRSVPATQQPRQGGQWRGRVNIASDFDSLPDDLQEAFGMKDG